MSHSGGGPTGSREATRPAGAPRGRPADPEPGRRDAAQPARRDGPLCRRHDVALLDLDGVVYLGGKAVAHAPEAIRAAREQGMRAAFVTNNALRSPDTVAEHLVELGVEATAAEVVTSAQAAARMLAERLAPGSRVLVAGGDGLRAEVAAAGLEVVSGADDQPAAVVQGYDPTLDYARLAEAALAVRRGALWVASNTDSTVPTERGRLPGNGALVALVATATGATPLVAGKPELALHAESVRRSGAQHPLVVGDRLDTDIEGAVRAGTPSLLVLTGVSSPADVLAAAPERRPTYLAADLRGLLDPRPVTLSASPGDSADDGGAGSRGDVTVGRWTASVDGDSVAVRRRPDSAPGDAPQSASSDDPSPADEPDDPDEPEDPDDPDDVDGLDALRAACLAAWRHVDTGGKPVRQLSGDLPPALRGTGE